MHEDKDNLRSSPLPEYYEDVEADISVLINFLATRHNNPLHSDQVTSSFHASPTQTPDEGSSPEPE